MPSGRPDGGTRVPTRSYEAVTGCSGMDGQEDCDNAQVRIAPGIPRSCPGDTTTMRMAGSPLSDFPSQRNHSPAGWGGSASSQRTTSAARAIR